MSKSLKQHENEFNQAPVKKIIWVIVAIAALGICLTVGGYALGWFGEAAQVAKTEFGPKAALQKYEWFVNQAESLKRSDANIQTNAAQIVRLRATYDGLPVYKWPRDAREEVVRLEQVRTDLIMNYNRGVADYNAQSEKFNWTPFQSDAGVPPQKLTEYVTE